MRNQPRLFLTRLMGSRTLRITYQFYDSDANCVGPKFRLQGNAREWYQRYLSALYSGEERRLACTDRRASVVATDLERRSVRRRFSDRPFVELDPHTQLERDVQSLLVLKSRTQSPQLSFRS